jgi:hypothetical protein
MVVGGLTSHESLYLTGSDCAEEAVSNHEVLGKGACQSILDLVFGDLGRL